MKIVDSALVISTRSAEKLERKACEKFRKRIPFITAFLKHLPTFSECKAVIARRLSESVRWVSLPLLKDFQRFQRSEERRVGKEYRSECWPDAQEIVVDKEDERHVGPDHGDFHDG